MVVEPVRVGEGLLFRGLGKRVRERKGSSFRRVAEQNASRQILHRERT